MKIYFAIWLGETNKFIESLGSNERKKIHAAVVFLEQGDFRSVHVKTLSGVIKELIVKRYRIIFFVNRGSLYIVSIFMKKTNKTPRAHIEKAERLCKLIINNN
ncbi:MAG TPA: type II toxin-antitoxin system RelE/ParE family toxin [Candidatus Paceibacterota bacterium]|nr:type II toxin-antitoxin system RelE/ParE family toxin [Candidatus Paceibacterota bacterium]